ncbi:type II secretion system F family protein [Salana multivorans]
MTAAVSLLAALLAGGVAALLVSRQARWSPRRRLAPGVPPRQVVRLDRAVACELVAVLLASGSSVPDSLAMLGEATGEDELVVAARLLRWGAEWPEATEEIPGRWLGVVEPLRAAWVSGVDPGPALRTTAATWRARRAARAREAAERLAVRLVLPLGLCLLPAFILLGLVPVALAAASTLLGRG